MSIDGFESEVHAWGRRLAAQLPRAGRNPAALAERRMMQAMIGDPRLRAALFRFVDVRPACRDRAELVRHLHEYLEEAAIGSDGSGTARRLSSLVGRRALELPTASAAALGVAQMSHRFIAGEDAAAAASELTSLWQQGRCVTLDLLGEATLTEAEGRVYAARCADTLRELARASAEWQRNPLLEDDGLGPLPRANLSVKVSALTPHLRANAPARALEAARDQLLALLRLARDSGAHLHIDMESLDTRASITELVLELLSAPEFETGPSAGIVLQGYLTDSEEELERLLGWLREQPRATPFTIRLVKGAYWDHEVVMAAQHGWESPVFTDRRSCDRHYEHLTRRLLDARAEGLALRPAIASHNLRSLAHALAYSDHLGLAPEAIELQVLRGLGDDTAAAITAAGRRVRVYCPVGDLVAGMAYLVRRLLENTSNDSFLAAQTTGAELELLLEKP
ncbi:MAG TPA: proline dehydrogenase family protein [Solirubrobacteraceae bacterium]|jgi:RHH-type proline utilization regulon transcriptional repressor/proline dehydrogenase/delta 1-pyrroline-5-carboxylate dehydrogenase|nr:proline dehydrogenase family protein [Solirubrobacteraceae bacterium]